ncbi:MAG: efflux RND transporter permease subunit, partial [Gammaproteobacteria bacterium]|nr:efflux RND transporter permease subunit [Gammaproteobacteria bacterium]
SVYIRRAISLVKNNLGLGVLLAVGVLWFFLRSTRSTLIIATAIPVSLMVAFISLQLFGLTLNVISLAGLAFSVGLVLDAAIIVQENIVRFREAGEPVETAFQHGADQVRGALFASTMTTVAIFLPIIFMEGQIGQMFSDLALTLSVAVLASMVTALTIVPATSRLWLADFEQKDPVAHWWDTVTGKVMKLTDTPAARAFWIAALIALPIALTFALKPKADFLPSAEADAVQVFFNVPPGVNDQLFEHEIGAAIVERLRPHMDHEKEPYIRGYNLSMFGSFNVLYLYPLKPEQTEDFLALLRGPLLQGIPDTQAFVTRASLLSFGFNGGRTISVDLQGADIVGLMDAAVVGMGRIRELMPDATVRPVPGLSLAEPELQIIPNERLITQAGLTRQDVALAVRAMTGGLFVSEYFDGNDRYDVILRSGKWKNPEELAAMPIATPRSGPQTIGSLAEIKRTVGPTQLQRFDGQRTISLQVLPPNQTTVEEALAVLRDEAGPTISAALPEGSSIKYRGSADQLESALQGMLINFLLAVAILFVVMAAIFRSARDSLLVLLVMPLAIVGGFIALKALNLVTYQSLDILTMIGFIILLGLVVNNAILLVSQTRAGEESGMSRRDAVEQAVRVRARPVYMSTLTSVFGMLPLAVIPGVGSDIYRGLATVIVGGMFFSAIFTLILMPSLLRLGEQRRETDSSPVELGIVQAGVEK